MSPLGSFADWQLTQPATPLAVVTELARRAAGAEVARINRVVQGYSNEIYRVSCVDGQQVVVRILRFDDDVSIAAADGEVRAMDQARSAGVPVPDVLLRDTVDLHGRRFPVMVQRVVRGRPLAEVMSRLSEPRRQEVLVEIGGLIAKINSVRTYGARDASPTATLAELRLRRDVIIDGGGLSAREFDVTVDQLQNHLDDRSGDRRVLCHGDLSLKHFFVTGADANDPSTHVSGIIDFGDWQPGPRVHDLAILRVRSPGLELAALLEGYGTAADEGFRRDLDRRTLLVALRALDFGVTEDDRIAVGAARGLIGSLIS